MDSRDVSFAALLTERLKEAEEAARLQEERLKEAEKENQRLRDDLCRQSKIDGQYFAKTAGLWQVDDAVLLTNKETLVQIENILQRKIPAFYNNHCPLPNNITNDQGSHEHQARILILCEEGNY
jgi:hypothetical protein